MEIHVPSKHPIMTVREALVHLVIVTIGILIALSLEGVRQSIEHRSLAAEARENIHDEITRNKTELDQVLPKVASQQREFRKIHAAIVALLAGKPPGDDDVSLQPPLASLSAAAYGTAQVTGAFGYMEYEDVRRFTSLYDFQASYRAMQERFLSLETVLSGPLLVGGSIRNSAAAADLSITKRQIEEAVATLILLEQTGKALSGVYGGMLGAKPDR